MRVARDQAVAMVDLDHPTILGVQTGGDGPVSGRRDDPSAGIRGKADALVERSGP